MKKRIRKIGIAARLTAVVAVILAVFVGLWTFKLIENAQVVAAYRQVWKLTIFAGVLNTRW